MNCDICTELGDVVETMPATEASSGLADYLEGYIPVIVKAALESWPAYKRNITVEDIAEVSCTSISEFMLYCMRLWHHCSKS